MISRSNWDPTTQRFVGFIDIMGFKDIVSRNSHATVYEKLKTISNFRDQVAEEDNRYGSTKLFIFSDSIIVFSEDDSISVNHFLHTINDLTNILTASTIPYRGAIAWGELTVDDYNSIFFGQPLIDAYVLSEELALYAVSMHHTAEKRILNSHVGRFTTTQYNTPVKGGFSYQYLIRPFLSAEEIKKRMDNYRTLTSGYLRKYIDNTEAFFYSVKKS